jgi:hypothetical protein
MTKPVTSPASARGVLNRQGPKRLASRGECPYRPACPISHVPVVACWSVDLRTRGRKNASRRGSRATAPPPMNGPAAGGEPAAPPEAGDAAQSNDGAGFFGLCRVPSPATEEACPSCRACGRGFPFQTMAPRSLWLRFCVSGVFRRPTAQRHRCPLSSPEGRAARMQSEDVSAFPPCGTAEQCTQFDHRQRGLKCRMRGCCHD